MNTSNEDFGAGKGERNEMSFSVTVISYCQNLLPLMWRAIGFVMESWA
jgi:hypothetical protein